TRNHTVNTNKSVIPFDSSKVLLTVCFVIPALCVLYAASATPVKQNRKSTSSTSINRAAGDTYASEITPLIRKYCVACHAGSKPAGGAALLTFRTRASVLKDKKLWERVSQNLSASTMPPSGAPQPTASERDQLVTWIDTTLSTAECVIKD